MQHHSPAAEAEGKLAGVASAAKAAAVTAASASTRKLLTSDASINAAFAFEWPSESYAVTRISSNLGPEDLKSGLPAAVWENTPADEPVCITLPAVFNHLRADPELVKQMGMFEGDCAASAEFKTAAGRAAKLSNDNEIDRALALFGHYLPPGRYRPDPSIIIDTFKEDPRRGSHMAKLLLETWCHIWGMQAKSTYFGYDILGLGTARITFAGFRSIVLFSTKRVVELGGEALGISCDSTSDQVRAALSLHFDKFAPLMDPSAVRHITAGPGDCVVTPCGWMCLERTSEKAAFGLRRVVQFAAAGAREGIQDLSEHRTSPSAVLESIMTLLGAAPAQGAAAAAAPVAEAAKEVPDNKEKGVAEAAAEQKESAENAADSAEKGKEGEAEPSAEGGEGSEKKDSGLTTAT